MFACMFSRSKNGTTAPQCYQNCIDWPRGEVTITLLQQAYTNRTRGGWGVGGCNQMFVYCKRSTQMNRCVLSAPLPFWLLPAGSLLYIRVLIFSLTLLFLSLFCSFFLPSWKVSTYLSSTCWQLSLSPPAQGVVPTRCASSRVRGEVRL